MMLCDSCFHANTCMNFCVGEGAYVMSGCQYYDNADRLRELAEADKDGLCVVLPCKVGDTAYITSDGQAYECVLDDVLRYNVKNMNLEIICKFDGICNGKQTVFLTCESAEAALKAGDTP